MVFKVPQFIEVEDKIFGPLTFKQFVYLVGGAGAAFLFWTFLPHFIAIFPIAFFAGLALALAFYKVNNRPFVILLEAYVSYYLNGKLYLWRKDQKPKVPAKGGSAYGGKIKDRPNIAVPVLSGDKLRDLAWSLDVNENVQS
ncbi:MAG TPA: PrgI family protein [Candidatus Paceibacterota bacterium]